MIKKRMELLREDMRNQGVNWFYCKDGDPHMSEYVDPHYAVRTHFSGFTGSNGNLLVGLAEAYLWTDGRYFVQAEKELQESGITLMKMGQKDVPTILKFLKDNLKEKETLALDGKVFSASIDIELKGILAENKAKLTADFVFDETLWENRPLASKKPVWILEEQYAGENAACKIEKIRKALVDQKVDFHFISKLDDIMWITNLRGNDIACNPVAYAYLFLTMDDCILFLKEEAVDESVRNYLTKQGIRLMPYGAVAEYIGTLVENRSKKVLLSGNDTGLYFSHLFEERFEVVYGENPSENEKAIKNKIEIANLKEAYLMDSLVVTRFIKYIKENAVNEKLTETKAAHILDEMRAALPGFIELSFPTISAFGPNAAMMHYEAEEGKDALLEENGIYLVDSGGQYYKGTTDVTRSIVLGNISAEMKDGYTRAVRGNLHLLNAKFLKGCTGRNLDILAREPFWEVYEDYKCGTGHGIGQVLNVHEGPQNISWAKRAGQEAAIVPGMIVSDEPGIYVKDGYGIRIETILLCESLCVNENGEYLGFSPLTFVPIDLDGIDVEGLSKREKDMLNTYHEVVYEKLSPFMDAEERSWLQENTRHI